MQPTAMGRTPPPFFCKANRLAPKKNGRTEVGVLPQRTNSTNEVRADRMAFLPLPAPELIRSFKCWGFKPSGPPADPLGNDLIAHTIISSGTGMVLSWTGSGGMDESG